MIGVMSRDLTREKTMSYSKAQIERIKQEVQSVYDYIKTHEHVSRREICDALNIHYTSMQHRLQILRKSEETHIYTYRIYDHEKCCTVDLYTTDAQYEREDDEEINLPDFPPIMLLMLGYTNKKPIGGTLHKFDDRHLNNTGLSCKREYSYGVSDYSGME